MRALGVLALCACNQVYDLSRTVEVDARYFDGTIEPYACPEPGAPIPFSPKLTQLQLNCRSYTATADRALALCRDGNFERVATGPLEGPFTVIPELSLDDPFYPTTVSIAPDGELLLLSVLDNFSAQLELRVYRLAGGTWQRDADLPMSPSFAMVTTNPSRGPNRRIIFQAGGATNALGEFVEDTGFWNVRPLQAVTTLGVPSLQPIWLSADGLRMAFMANIFAGDNERYLALAQRASIDAAFERPARLSLPVVFDVFITGNCSRAYFPSLQSLFYAQQQP